MSNSFWLNKVSFGFVSFHFPAIPTVEVIRYRPLPGVIPRCGFCVYVCGYCIDIFRGLSPLNKNVVNYWL